MKKIESDSTNEKKERVYLSQLDIPAYSLEDALRVPQSIIDNYAGQPTNPLQVAKAMNMQPGSGHFRMLCGAAIAYGLTSGGYNATEIKVEPLAKRILQPTIEGDDLNAKKEAFLRPRVINEFLTKYNNSRLPRDDIAKNVLIEFGIPKERTDKTLSIIIDNARMLGLIEEIKGASYVSLSGAAIANPVQQAKEETTENDKGVPEEQQQLKMPPADPFPRNNPSDLDKKRKVFITHGTNKSFIEPIKKLLKFGELEAIVSIERSTVSKPVPDKVLEDMRSCGAAIIHVDIEKTLIDKDAKEHTIVNPNVLIEIGAAMALFGRRFILLVRDGVELPSNIQGLYEVRYTGETLDGEVTIKLLEAINNMKDSPLPKTS